MSSSHTMAPCGQQKRKVIATESMFGTASGILKLGVKGKLTTWTWTKLWRR